mgnify:CR=1 FL=1
MDDSQKFEEVCKLLESGYSLRSIFVMHDSPMSNTLFYRLLKENKDLNERYARAKEIYADTIFDEILEISDESNADIQISDKDGSMYINGEAVQRSRLKVDARKWVLSKLAPKKYGDKLDIDHTTNGQSINQIDYSKLSDAALEEIANAGSTQGEG